jgi:hypothetical protein
LAGFESTLMAGFEGGFLAACTGRAARNSALDFSHYLFTKVGIAGEFDAEGQAIPMTIPVKNPRQKKSENSDVGHQPYPWGYPTRIQLTVVQKYVHL